MTKIKETFQLKREIDWINDVVEKLRRTDEEINFEAEEHKYFVGTGDNRREMISVSERLSFLREGMISFENPPQVMIDGMARGTAVHQATEDHDKGIIDLRTEENIKEDILGYLQAYLKFLDDKKPVYLGIETKVFVPEWETAGTIDRIAVRKTRDGLLRLSVIDIKTGQHNHKNAQQIGLYSSMVMKKIGIRNIPEKLLLYLHKDGSYKIRKMN